MNLSSDRHDSKVEDKYWDPPFPNDLCLVVPSDLKTGGAILGTDNSWTIMQIQNAITATALAPTVVSDTVPAADPLFRRIRPLAIIGFGLALTAAWACLLGYGLVILIIFAI
jgi:hypothetical protein